MSSVAPNPKDLLNQGATRAKNMGEALFMICFLLTKFFLVKVVGKRLERVLSFVLIRAAQGVNKLYVLLKPHLDHWRKVAVETKNQTVKISLGLLIVALTPVERAVLKFFGIARVQSEKIAVQGTASAISLVVPVFRALGAALQAGLSKPAVQRLATRIFELLEDAQKA